MRTGSELHRCGILGVFLLIAKWSLSTTLSIIHFEFVPLYESRERFRQLERTKVQDG